MKLSELDPKDYQVVSAPKLKLSDLHPHDYTVVPPEPEPSQSPVTAATTGLIQGAVPFASALAGVGKAGLDAITGERGPLAGGSLSDIADDYRHARDEFAQDAKTSAAANPKTALAANIVGGVANPLFKGANTLGKSAAAGAVQNLGMSDADLTKGDVGKAAIDTAIGAAGGAAGHIIAPKIIQGVKSIASGAGSIPGWIAKKALTTLGPSEEAVTARMAGKAQPTAKSYPELAEDIVGTVKNLGQQTGELDAKAATHLSDEPKFKKADVIKPIDNQLNNLKFQGQVIGPENEKIARTLETLKNGFSKLNDKISEKDVKQLIGIIDSNTNWADQTNEGLNNAFKDIRNGLDEGLLKPQNPEYAEAMKPVAERMQVMNAIRKKFNFQNVPGEGLGPTDTTASKIQNALGENKAVTQEDLGKLKDFTGRDFLNESNDYRLAKQFQSTGLNGARKAVTGASLGAAAGSAIPGVGPILGAGVGGSLGAVADKYGNQSVGAIIDLARKAASKGDFGLFGKFAPVIEKASQQGPTAVAVASAILNKNPEFRALLSGLPAQKVPLRKVSSDN
jgi:hypothetical protein